ncbi:MAG TPA: NAD(P)H-hydrate dehydratase [Anaerolineales bacterium]|nr:NAD(P)H-hydrate dehydratase [Anaerolineales bacterium]
MKLVTVAEMHAIEQQADASGLTYAQMMENAGRGLAEIINDEYGYLSEEGILALVGKGNNGGDALVALAHLAGNGWRCSAYLAADRPDDPLVARLLTAGGETIHARSDSNHEQLADAVASHPLLLDGLLGTGIKLPLRGNMQYLLSNIQSLISNLDFLPTIIAVDCPSGLDCNTGETAPETLHADLTVTMAAAKPGFYAFPGADYTGEIQFSEIGDLDGLPAWDAVTRTVLDEQAIADLLPDRPRNAHKGTFGTVVAVAGSINYPGAALLSGKAAYRVGAGLVTLAVPRPVQPMLAGHFPEATWLPLPDEDGAIAADAADVLRANVRRATCLLIGPGFGLHHSTRQFLEHFIAPDLPPLVIDADGLKLLAQLPNWPQRLPPRAILTPHPGEMSILTGLDTKTLQADRINLAERFAQEWGHIVILKGAFTVVAAPDGQTALIPIATPALARAGTGDVLAGMIAGLRAQGLDAFDGAVAGAFLHGQAGLVAEKMLGNAAAVLAGDVLEGVGEVMGVFE